MHQSCIFRAPEYGRRAAVKAASGAEICRPSHAQHVHLSPPLRASTSTEVATLVSSPSGVDRYGCCCLALQAALPSRAWSSLACFGRAAAAQITHPDLDSIEVRPMHIMVLFPAAWGSSLGATSPGRHLLLRLSGRACCARWQSARAVWPRLLPGQREALPQRRHGSHPGRLRLGALCAHHGKRMSCLPCNELLRNESNAHLQRTALRPRLASTALQAEYRHTA